MIQNHPECRRDFLGVWGPKTARDKLIITREDGAWVWRYKRAGESHYGIVGAVSECRNPYARIRSLNLVDEIL